MWRSWCSAPAAFTTRRSLLHPVNDVFPQFSRFCLHRPIRLNKFLSLLPSPGRPGLRPHSFFRSRRKEEGGEGTEEDEGTKAITREMRRDDIILISCENTTRRGEFHDDADDAAIVAACRFNDRAAYADAANCSGIKPEQLAADTGLPIERAERSREFDRALRRSIPPLAFSANGSP